MRFLVDGDRGLLGLNSFAEASEGCRLGWLGGEDLEVSLSRGDGAWCFLRAADAFLEQGTAMRQSSVGSRPASTGRLGNSWLDQRSSLHGTGCNVTVAPAHVRLAGGSKAGVGSRGLDERLVLILPARVRKLLPIFSVLHKKTLDASRGRVKNYG